ncbi:carbamoyl-phosphate synthase large subunit [Brevibacterium sp. HMSC24B04]|uniref:carbamoyl-phosphate synthase large subunit n=1 Tax=Brevibacterium sp. HMSC24B04 TaxID=1581060 RepID=UPI0008A24369|nr:carbamoyl-phosphate synthase large subunit [Brevibacterium sp. HMSC24B04]OFT95156.1 carbamoyl phosphate synthase large subunit [Brevibacterium sp. HMSC24B04]
MPLRTDIKTVMVIGSGPIVIGQACEFDYSGTQACRILRREGLRVVLVNSNPATIMTDPELADATYVEPIDPDVIEKIIEKEKPDALLPTLGGQTALNAAINLHESGVLAKHGVELIGADVDAIQRGEDRQQFKDVVEQCGAEVARSYIANTMDEVLEGAEKLGYPLVVRPSFTMGGLGSGMAYSEADLRRIAGDGLHDSLTNEVLLEESILGWKEFELELIRDKNDNVIVVCAIENFDPVGVHTGDAITVAPSLTLTDVEYQKLRDIGIAIIRGVGVETGGCNIQFAIHPDTGRVVVIEMNPRVSRSSALASKATGFPIAKIAAKLAVGYTLDEIPNDITATTPAAFEPALDYVVAKIPRFAFEKFPAADPTLTTTMKAVGEVMALGRNFTTALQKALRSLEKKNSEFSFDAPFDLDDSSVRTDVEAKLAHATEDRIYTVQRALMSGMSIDDVFENTKIDRWFLDQIALINEVADFVREAEDLTPEVLTIAKKHGFSDRQIAQLRNLDPAVVMGVRHALGVRPVYKSVDTCAGEFEAKTPYYYSSYDATSEVAPREREAVIILGSGPNRIGQGIEFDYSCVHAAMALESAGYETVMVNCNPETVSTDYDTADRLYFEPLTLEDVLEVYHAEAQAGPVAGVICTLGGQTPLGLATALKDAGVPILGTQPEAIDLAEDRGEFGRIMAEANLVAPKHGTAVTFDEAVDIAEEIGYPVLVRPSYVLGGRGMQIVYDSEQLRSYMETATEVSSDRPVLVDKFLDDAVEIDVDALYDGEELYIGGISEHIEEAGVHSGDSTSVLPSISLGESVLQRVREATLAIARGTGVRGLLNIQFAVAADILYVIEANPRASRTVPFVSKATHRQLAKAAALIAVGSTISQLRGTILAEESDGSHLPLDHPVTVKEVVLPFRRFRTPEGKVVDSILGPEMRSTGEVMGIAPNFPEAFAKAQLGASTALPTGGRVFVSIADRDKRSIVLPVKTLADMGFEIIATAGTADVLARHGVPSTRIAKHYEAEHGEDTILQKIDRREIDLVVNVPSGRQERSDGYEIRAAAIAANVPIMTTTAAFSSAVGAIDVRRRGTVEVRSLQDWA